MGATCIAPAHPTRWSCGRETAPWATPKSVSFSVLHVLLQLDQLWPHTQGKDRAPQASTSTLKGHHPLWIFKNLFIFNWRIIALQYRDGFCHTSTWISCRHAYVSSLLSLPSPPHPSRLSQSTSFGIAASHSKFPLAIYFTYGNVYVSMLLSQLVPPSLSPFGFLTQNWISERLNLLELCVRLCYVCVCVIMHLRSIERVWVHSFHYFAKVHDLRNINSKPLLFERKLFEQDLRS